MIFNFDFVSYMQLNKRTGITAQKSKNTTTAVDGAGMNTLVEITATNTSGATLEKMAQHGAIVDLN